MVKLRARRSQYPISVDVSYRTQAKRGVGAALSRTPPIQEGGFHGTRRHTWNGDGTARKTARSLPFPVL